jgi:hypothetical protein
MMLRVVTNPLAGGQSRDHRHRGSMTPGLRSPGYPLLQRSKSSKSRPSGSRPNASDGQHHNPYLSLWALHHEPYGLYTQ